MRTGATALAVIAVLGGGIVVSGPPTGGSGAATASQEEMNRAAVQRAFEAINSRNYGLLDDLIVDDYVRHSQATPEVQVRSREEFKSFLAQDAATFPDAQIRIDRLAAEGDLVAFYGTYMGTQKGPMGAFPPTGNQMVLEFAGFHRFQGGKIAETWVTWDNLAALKQLGHYPPPPKGEQ